MTSAQRGGIFVLGILFTYSVFAQAQYPGKPIRIVVPTSQGGSADLIARLIAQPLTARLGQQVVVDNRTGAGTVIGTEVVAKAPPDGYTLLLALSALAINPSIYRKLGYDAVRDFAPIIQAGSSPQLLVVHPSVPVRSVKELIALAKARPGEVAFAYR